VDSPIVNPCFVIENWHVNTEINMTINGEYIKPGSNFRQVIEKTADGISSLVIWIKKESVVPVDITLYQ